MAIELIPRVAIQPVRSQTGGAQGGVEPMRDATGATLQAIGEGAQDVGRAITGVAVVDQHRINRAQSVRGEVLLTDAARRLFESPDGGFFNTVGQDAVADRTGAGAVEVGGARRRAFEALRAERQKIAKLMTTPEQKLEFAQQADRIEAELQSRADRHQAVQARAYEAGQATARSELLIREGADEDDPDKFAVAKAVLLRETDARADALGVSPEQAAGMRMDATTKLWQDRTERLVTAGRWQQAAQEITQHQKEIESGPLDDLRRKVRAAAVQERAATLADAATRLELQIVSEAARGVRSVEIMGVTSEVDTDTPHPLGTYARQKLDEHFAAGKIGAELREATMRQIDYRVAKIEHERAVAGNAVVEAAQREAVARGVRDVRDLAPATQEALRSTDKVGAMRTWFKNDGAFVTTSQGEQFVARVEADPSELARFRTPDQLLAAMAEHLSPKDQRLVAARWREQRGEMAKGDEKFIGEELVLRVAARQAGIIPADGSKPTDEQLATRDAWELAVRREAFARSKDGKVTSTELRKVAAEVAMDRMRVGGQDVPFLASTKEQQNEGSFTTSTGRVVYARNVSEQAREQILEGIRQFNEEARRRNLSLPPERRVQLKPETMSQIVEEWEMQNVQERKSEAVEKYRALSEKDRAYWRELFKLSSDAEVETLLRRSGK